ncbi:MAG: cobalamin-binding protein [Deltaproteobacteria bacterium]|nr:cobalamin-binding protein [Deltaproteobacteria bacterium]
MIKGDLQGVKEGVTQVLGSGYDPGDILNTAMIHAMQEVGRRFEIQECFIPEMLIAARAMHGGLEVLRPHLVEADVEPAGKVVLGTVKGDLHDIGKNLVGMLFEGAGFHVVDLGVNVPPEKFVEAIRQHQPDFIGLSALLTTTMPAMETTIRAIKDVGLRDRTIVMVGGAPVNQAFADKIGADIYASNAASAAKMASTKLKRTK